MRRSLRGAGRHERASQSDGAVRWKARAALLIRAMNSPLALVVIVLAASVLSVGICRRPVALPSLLGYLTVGMLLGPQAFKLIPDSEQARPFAESTASYS